MSKIGKKPIEVPSSVQMKFDGEFIQITGPKGVLSVLKPRTIEITQSGSQLLLQPSGEDQQTGMDWGTTRSLIQNAILGVTEGFSKKLEIEGVGFKANIEGNNLVLKVGFSHTVPFPIPQGIAMAVDKNVISIEGIDKQQVGQVAAVIRKIKKPEPYLGKGIRYQGEVVRRKDGKKAGTATK